VRETDIPQGSPGEDLQELRYEHEEGQLRQVREEDYRERWRCGGGLPQLQLWQQGEHVRHLRQKAVSRG